MNSSPTPSNFEVTTSINSILSIDHSEIDLIKRCLSNIDISSEDNRLIKQFSETGILPIVQFLLDEGADPSCSENLCIQLASQSGHSSVVKLLLEDFRVDPTAEDNYAIRYACENGHLEVIEFLLNQPKYKIDLSIDDNYCIKSACESGHHKVVKLLLRWRPEEYYSLEEFPSGWYMKSPRIDASAANNYALIRAVKNGHYKVVQLLLSENSHTQINPSIPGNAAVRIAVTDAHSQILSLLLRDKRVNPYIDHGICIMNSAERGNWEILEILLNDQRVNLNSDDRSIEDTYRRHQQILYTISSKNDESIRFKKGSRLHIPSEFRLDKREKSRIISNSNKKLVYLFIGKILRVCSCIIDEVPKDILLVIQKCIADMYMEGYTRKVIKLGTSKHGFLHFS